MWCKQTSQRFKRLALSSSVVVAGGRARSSAFALLRLRKVYCERLRDFPDNHVALEGGGSTLTAKEFIRSEPCLRSLEMDSIVTVVVFKLVCAL